MQTVLVKIGSRSSSLALIQAGEVREALRQAHGMRLEQIEIVPMSTKGDRITDRSLAQIGGKGLFTQEIEQALLEGSIDIAVHSTKDMPTLLPEGLQLDNFLPREDPRDVFIGREQTMRLDNLPKGAVIGTSSLRRQAFLRHYRPDLNITGLRGNIETRLAKLQQGAIEGTFLALAGLRRLEMEAVISEILPETLMLPAPGQGAIGMETRVGDANVARLLAPISCTVTRDVLICERSFLATLDGSCRTPLGGLARLQGDIISFQGAIASLDGAICHHVEMQGKRHEAAEIGRMAAEKLRRDADKNFFDDWK